MPTKAFSQAKLLGADNTISVTSLSADIPITEKLATVDDLPNTGVIGEQAFVEATNRLYIWNGTGWYNIALINETPTWDSGGQPEESYTLDGDSPQDATIISLAASDPEGLPINYTYVTGGSMDSIATISQDSSVFTITPKTSSQAPDGGTGSITFRATDGVNILPQVSSFTLNFVSVITDSKYTTLLATATGTSDNNNITDASSSNHTIIVNGDAHAGTFSPYRSGGYSLGFAGDSYITLSNSSTFELTGDFCIDGFWYLPTTNSGTIFELGQYQNGILFGPDQYDNGIYVNGSKLTGLASSVTTNTWQHFAIVRKGSGSNNFKLYIDGTKVAESTITGNINTNYSSSYTNIRIGSATHSSSAAFDLDDGSYIRDLRIVKGDSVYPSSSDSVPPNSITVPTEKSTAITGTILLAGALPYLADASGTSNTFTPTNTVSTKPFLPYDYEEYVAANNGGSVYFDGSGDVLEVTSSSDFVLSTGDFTVECWVYFNTIQVCNIADNRGNGNGFSLQLNGSNYLGIWDETTSTTLHISNLVMKTNSWYHVCYQRSGTTSKFFINGVQQGSDVTHSGNFTSNSMVLGSRWSTDMQYFHGFLSNFRLIKGTAVHNSNFTAPTIPVTDITNTKLLVNGTDASIIDKSQGTNLKLVGDTTGSTTQVKFAGTKSMYFDGSDRIEIDGPINLGTQPFTYEAWVYTTDSSWIFMCIGNHDGSSSHANAGSFIEYVNNDFYLYNFTGSGNTSAEAFVHNQGWKHVAFCRQSNGNHDLYLDGTRIINYTGWNSQDYGSLDKILIGDYFTQFMSNFAGYFQDVRLTLGKSRYTANFTPPTAPLEG